MKLNPVAWTTDVTARRVHSIAVQQMLLVSIVVYDRRPGSQFAPLCKFTAKHSTSTHLRWWGLVPGCAQPFRKFRYCRMANNPVSKSKHTWSFVTTHVSVGAAHDGRRWWAAHIGCFARHMGCDDDHHVASVTHGVPTRPSGICMCLIRTCLHIGPPSPSQIITDAARATS